jgi:hypothetical protein
MLSQPSGVKLADESTAIARLLSPIRRSGAWYAIFVLFCLHIPAGSWAQSSDTTPPVLVSYQFSPSTVDASKGPAAINGTIQLTDNLSGVSSAYIEFSSPSGQSVFCRVTSGPSSGTTLNGTFPCSGTFPQFSEAGTWNVARILAYDQVGNSNSWAIIDFQNLGLPTTLQVVSTSDLTPPSLLSYQFLPVAMDTSSGPVPLTGSLQLTDNLSGIDIAYIAFSSPSGKTIYCNASSGPSSGTPLNGPFSCSCTFPRFSDTGVWRVSEVAAVDKVGNISFWSTSDLTALGLSTTLQVSGTPDTTPPVLVTYQFSPAVIATVSGPASVTGTLQLSDDLSGVNSAAINFSSPTGKLISCSAVTGPSSGTPLNGTFSCSCTFPQFSEVGSWIVSEVTVLDNAGNSISWPTATLAASGLPTVLQLAASAPPGTPANPSPANNATGVSATPTLTWTGGGDATSHDVYFGTSSTPPLIANVSGASYNPGTLSSSTTYYWRIVAKNNVGSTSSATWSFTTVSPGCSYSVSLPGISIPSGNFTGTVSVTAAIGCPWTAASDTYWLNITSGTSGAGSGTVGFTAFSNTQTSSRGATITVRDAGGIAVGTFVVTQSGGAAPLNVRRVTMFYQSFLGREPDPAGLAYWSTQDPATLGLAFYVSDEFKILSYRAVQIYRALLNREPLYTTEYLQAVNGIRTGTSAPADLANRLITQLGIATTTQLASTMCANLYPFAPSGSYSNAACQNDVQTLAGHGFTGGALVVKFLDSYYATTPWQNRYAVYLMYAVTLNRPPDDAGFNYWLTTMTQNNYDNYWLVKAFVISAEFTARFN